MAWRSSGTNNAEMVDKLTRFGVITSDHIERAFRRVDRKFFVPRGSESIAHSDQPLKEGNIHISAPHIYASAMEALDLVPDSSLSFLNIGSGTGYISCIVAEILGPKSLHYGVELHEDVIDHCKTSIAKWKANVVEEQGDVSTIHFMDITPNIQVVHGNGLNVEKEKGESIVGFDRIYIGAAVDKESFKNIIKLLSPGGILVGPVDDELIKVVRVGNIPFKLEEEMAELRMDDEYTSQILSGVRFAPLLKSPSNPTILPAHVWNPAVQQFYPSEHQEASMAILMCSNSEVSQPLPPVTVERGRINTAAMLPKGVWMEILSYTHRKWFEPEEDEVVYLKRRLREEKIRVARSEKALREAEDRCNEARREKAMYCMLACRWQNRLKAILTTLQQEGSHGNHHIDMAVDMMDGHLVDFLNGERPDGGLARLMMLLQQQLDDDDLGSEIEAESDRDYEDEMQDHDMEDMEEDVEQDYSDPQENVTDDLRPFFEDDNQSDTDHISIAEIEGEVPVAAAFSSTESSQNNDSVVMVDLESAKTRAYDQPRTVSISSADL